jgi:2-methylcitrate dehydratase PrpD
MAAAAGVHAARLVEAGATVPLDKIAPGFEQAFGGHWAIPGSGAAIRENWIKPYPCCLATHSTIEAVSTLPAPADDGRRALTIVVHPQARQAAALDDVSDGLEAKFSIPYLAMFTWLHGPPRLSSFATVDDDARSLARLGVTLSVDASLGEWEARVSVGDDGPQARVETALGSPQRPLDAESLSAKVHELAGDRLDGVLDDPARPVADVLAAGGI